MIIFIGPNRQRRNIKKFGNYEHAPTYKHRTYNWLFRTRRLPGATYIFTFIDRLDPSERRLAGKIYRHINQLGDGFKALNDPTRVKNRYQLLRALFQAGVNDFDVHLAAESPHPKRFPVFIRRISQSLPPLTDLVADQANLDRIISELQAAGEPLDDLMVIEFCAAEIAPGIFQKYSAYRAGDQVSMNYTIFESNWQVKIGQIDIVDPVFYDKEAEDLEQNAYAEIAGQVFDIAQIEYGRADFGLVDGRPQFYEINFNPEFRTTESTSKVPQRKQNVARAVEQRFKDVAALDRPATQSQPNISNPELTAFRWRFWRNYAPQRY
ncbi:hypothetical protein MXMO3_00163 [Maritalea myrionectae]|uniref:ATP-grasp domain-containing protein n=1 Tax=Maritalea myrionectae TaxID=454601 RepID=A0A2R4M9K2_9HYPH|nr:hypothetical protein [Maritalea myrionectae]AVX02711.1 hypothetical protein MXMO3_00163 [Maritalea myrionectae]